MFEESTAPYLIAAYVVFLGGIAVYVLSLVVRRRALDREEQVLDQISDELAAGRNTGDIPRSAGSQRPEA